MTIKLPPKVRPAAGTPPDVAYWQGYAAGFLDGKLTAIGAVVDTFAPDNGMKAAARELGAQIGARR